MKNLDCSFYLLLCSQGNSPHYNWSFVHLNMLGVRYFSSAHDNIIMEHYRKRMYDTDSINEQIQDLPKLRYGHNQRKTQCYKIYVC